MLDLDKQHLITCRKHIKLVPIQVEGSCVEDSYLKKSVAALLILVLILFLLFVLFKISIHAHT